MSDHPIQSHSLKSRTNIQQECATEMRRIKATRKELNEQAGDIRKRLRDVDINVKAWEAALRISDMEDVEARDAYMDGLRESFEALGVGQQMDWVAAQEQKAA